jgi:hypothetical protein
LSNRAIPPSRRVLKHLALQLRDDASVQPLPVIQLKGNTCEPH